MTSIYNKGRVCTVSGRPCLPLEPDLTDLMSNSRDPKQLLEAWVGWRDVTRPIKPLYTNFVNLKNIGAVENGYSDYGAYWRDELFGDTPDLEEMAAKLWVEVEPLYTHLHAYVRSKLRDFYGDNVDIEEDGGIPAHILGNMWGQNWAGIYEIVKPYNTVDTNRQVEDRLKEEYDVNGMFRLAEEFYSSIGLYNMTDKFWNNSMLSKPADREVQCHASAFDLYQPGDFRIKMCSEVNLDYFQTIHHEMGHVEYYMAYESQPLVYRNGANSAFHEAVGDTIALSVRSRKHLETIGLLDEDTLDDDESDINTLLLHALNKISFLPFGYLVDKWRYDVFRGEITHHDYNEKWWDLRYEYQGISPPVERKAYGFDPGAKFHIPSNSPYISYFFSFILQFQFYQRMCELSGHQGALHTCDFYGSEEAGSKFREMLALGSSIPWPEALERFTGSREVSAKPLLEYFQPLMNWLEEVNEENESIVGWK
ncbi:hypothetical protein LOTGIDRAFT_115941 [Lottia gigantea]|uniref:Angiotensin-converting enzyme n=1 Tax=Lottia gigantea TaxID=225164 RepID=V4AHL1_LOTGI|nr:hypothetical protein LOTGIDRAFT_115941 [Lottia gigantea]ESO96402.1 hypothetical protein LOTGIDRAFT_115941 [Lottia gigantea]